MQFKHRKVSPKCCKVRRKKHGFALIASLTLMMLLSLLAVGILSVASSQRRIATQTVLQSQARQQALMGLDAALGELQVEAGPDQRVTASSSILTKRDDDPAQHLLGVWNSWDGPIYGKSASDKASNIRDTYDAGRKKMFRRWLVSSANPEDARKIDAYAKLISPKPGRRICLVGEGTVGARADSVRSREVHHVYADLISMELDGNNRGCFAWWIGGENQKCKISVTAPKDTSDVAETLHRTWDTPPPVFIESKTVTFLSDDSRIEIPEKLLTMASLPLVERVERDAGMPYFFDVTTSSYSLLTDVRNGGFKKDLCLLLDRESLKGTPYAGSSEKDCPLVRKDDLNVPLPIGSWQVMHAYYNCWPDGSGKDDDMGTRLVGGLGKGVYTRMAGSLPVGGDSDNTYYDPRADLSQNLGYPRTPVMLAFMNNFGLVVDPGDGQVTSDTKEPIYQLRMCFAPMVLWWNPYNVEMRVRGKKLWAQAVPYKSMWLQTYSNTAKTEFVYDWGTYAVRQGSDKNGFGQDWGNYFQKSVSESDSDIVFAPGEIVFFSPGVARISTEYNKPYSNPWVEGYNPTSVAGYKAHFYGMSGESKIPTVCCASNISQELFEVGIRLGIDEKGGSYTSDGHWFVPGRKEAITVYNGFDGMGAANSASGGSGKHGDSPQRFLLGWYDPANPGCSTELCHDTWKMEGQDDPNAPYFIASVGVVAKSANPNMDTKLFPRKDFRTKVWQHSSPAFFGGIIITPDNQQRQYHPYQLAAYDVGGAAAASPMDNIGRNGMLGITSDGEQVSFAAVCELPLHPPFSLAGFAGMRLQPGWYKTSGSGSRPAMRRAQYQNGVPGVGIGNSFADPCLPPDNVARTAKTNVPLEGQISDLFNLFYDHGLLINDALWDSWFCSSISDMPTTKGRKKKKDVLKNFLAGETPLPVSRYKRAPSSVQDKTIEKAVLKDDGWRVVAQYLVVDGGFNVNSTSEEAWAALLQGLSGRKLVTNAENGKLTLLDESKKDSKGNVLFSRFMVSTSKASLDSLGGYSPMQGSSALRSGMSDLTAWGEVRSIDSHMIRQLAKEMVKQVRARGPFLNMSDFINRRLASSSGSDSPSLKGALQAAIDATTINSMFDEQRVKAASDGSLYVFPEAETGSLYTAAPGYLIQSDVLASLGNILTVRDDTFTIRAYGCVRNNDTGAILAQAWCEAVVQRTVDYVDPTNAAITSPNPNENANLEGASKPLSKLNKVMGRKFRIVSFKWLDAWDI